jgi:ABC-type multidrug transport system fused ATPase/permease subunit
MVLEKDKLQEKRLGSEAVISNDIDELDEIGDPKSGFSPVPFASASPTGKNPNKIVFQLSHKKKIQLTFEDVLIQTVPQQRKCCNRNAVQEKPKIILNKVSGTIQPGQFLAIIGASGTHF